MRKLIAGLFASLDGYASDAPNEEMAWVTAHFGDEMAEYGLEQLRAVDTLLFGRVTFESMAGYWPTAGEDEGEFADLMNNTTKIVFSSTLKDDLGWQNSRVVNSDDLPAAITQLKQQPGKDIGMTGSVELVGSLMKLGLIDRLRLEVHPIVLGPAGGKPIFDGYDTTELKLAETTVLDGRVVVLDYEPTTKEQR